MIVPNRAGMNSVGSDQCPMTLQNEYVTKAVHGGYTRDILGEDGPAVCERET
jgi:hypothetical protein